MCSKHRNTNYVPKLSKRPSVVRWGECHVQHWHMSVEYKVRVYVRIVMNWGPRKRNSFYCESQSLKTRCIKKLRLNFLSLLGKEPKKLRLSQAQANKLVEKLKTLAMFDSKVVTNWTLFSVSTSLLAWAWETVNAHCWVIFYLHRSWHPPPLPPPMTLRVAVNSASSSKC